MVRRSQVEPGAVRLERGHGSTGRGDGAGGSYWHIYVDGKRAGHVYVTVWDKPPFGRHAEIQINLNKDQQGRRIGRVAYRLAAEQSGHDLVYAHMKKSNIASRHAAAAAGFEVADVPAQPGTVRQLSMRWQRRRDTRS